MQKPFNSIARAKLDLFLTQKPSWCVFLPCLHLRSVVAASVATEVQQQQFWIGNKKNPKIQKFELVYIQFSSGLLAEFVDLKACPIDLK